MVPMRCKLAPTFGDGGAPTGRLGPIRARLLIAPSGRLRAIPARRGKRGGVPRDLDEYVQVVLRSALRMARTPAISRGAGPVPRPHVRRGAPRSRCAPAPPIDQQRLPFAAAAPRTRAPPAGPPGRVPRQIVVRAMPVRPLLGASANHCACSCRPAAPTDAADVMRTCVAGSPPGSPPLRAARPPAARPGKPAPCPRSAIVPALRTRFELERN